MGQDAPLLGVGTPKQRVTCDFAPPCKSINRSDSAFLHKPKRERFLLPNDLIVSLVP
jgi:hypothetical protein